MPRRGSGAYPADWPAFARALKDAADWTCERCQHPHDPTSGHTLTVHHLTLNKSEPFEHWYAFAVLCQRCHLRIQGKVDLERPWILEHSPWFQIHAAGWYAAKYLGLTLSRTEVESRLDELLALEARAILGSDPIAHPTAHNGTSAASGRKEATPQ